MNLSRLLLRWVAAATWIAQAVNTVAATSAAFGPPIETLTPDRVYDAAAADINRDGRLDLVTANTGTNTMTVLLGKGDGAFVALTNYDVGLYPNKIAVGDFNRDGNLDVVTVNSSLVGEGSMSVLLGHGDGTYDPATTSPIGPFPGAVVARDFDRDGHADLAAVEWFKPAVRYGRGNGTFSPVTYLDALLEPGEDAEDVIAEDFNGDGILDLATVNAYFSGSVSILLGPPPEGPRFQRLGRLGPSGSWGCTPGY